MKYLHNIWQKIDSFKNKEELFSEFEGENKHQFKSAIGEIEVSLKNEIGVYIEEYRALRRETTIENFEEAKKKNKAEKNKNYRQKMVYPSN